MSCCKKPVILLIAIISTWACADTTAVKWESSPSMGFRSNDLYYTSIEPIIRPSGCVGFTLRIVNASEKDLELNWNNSFFISNGRVHGGFIFEGTALKDRSDPGQTEIIAVNESISKNIFPSTLVSFSDRKTGGWRYRAMSAGENGVYLTINAGDLQVHEKITVRLFALTKSNE